VGEGVPALQAEMQTMNNDSNTEIRLNASIMTGTWPFREQNRSHSKTAKQKAKCYT
jgi:hypothetical protein